MLVRPLQEVVCQFQEGIRFQVVSQGIELTCVVTWAQSHWSRFDNEWLVIRLNGIIRKSLENRLVEDFLE